MNLSMKNLSLVFVAGLVGGLLNCLAVWLFGRLGIAQALGVQIAPPLSTALLYPKLVWGGLWGLLFLVPMGQVSFTIRGLIFSLGPSLVQLFWVFPVQAHKGVLGLQLGALTPLFVLFYNAVWGLAAGWWLNLVRRN
ncbi:MAG: hypothetical protein ACYC6G_18130 [Desulfobaccales bacterium]